MGDFGVVRDKWVCPNDRELSLRAKLKTGWSVKTSSINTFNKPEQLTDLEQEIIMTVIKRAENLEKTEQERVGRLVERLDNMKKNAMGNGTTQCVLCADEFGLLGASPLLCNDCRKAVCTKCGVDTISAQKEPLWLCKICAETRETWKKSGAWFYKGLPKYILPGRKIDHQSKYSTTTANKVIEHNAGSPARSYNSWLQAKGKGSSDKEYTDSSDDEIKSARLSKRTISRRPINDSVEGTDSATIGVNPVANQHSSNSLQKSVPPNFYHSAPVTTDVAYAHMQEYQEMDKSVLPDVATDLTPYSRDLDQAFYKMSPSKGQVDHCPDVSSSPSHWHRPRKETEDEEQMERNFHGQIRQDSHHSTSSPGSYGFTPSRHITQPPVSSRERNTIAEDTSFDERTSPEDTSAMEFSLLYDPQNQALHCTIYRAKGLRATDYNGLADPYVRLQLLPVQSKADKMRTRTVHKTLNPEFNETVSFYGITDYDIAKRILRMTILDEDPFGNDFMGEARVSLKRLRPHQAKPFFIYLERSFQVEEGDEESIRGQIMLSLMYSNDHHALIVGILRCIHLPARDTNGYSDPFVRVQLKPDHLRRRYKTSTKKKTLNPEFNEEFAFEVKPHEMSKKVLEITVWDKDYGKSDDYIGGLSLSIQSKGRRLAHFLEILKNPDRRIERWHPLTNSVVLD